MWTPALLQATIFVMFHCRVCCLQVNMLKRRDADQGHIAFVDIAAPDYDPADNAGISFEQVGACPIMPHLYPARRRCQMLLVLLSCCQMWHPYDTVQYPVHRPCGRSMPSKQTARW